MSDESSSYESGDAHGVSAQWVSDRVKASKADPHRKQQFAKKMTRTVDRNIAKAKSGRGGAGQAFKMASKARAGATAAKESGWDRWKKTGTHGYDEGGRHDDR